MSSDLMATVVLAPGATVDSDLHQAIGDRRSNRSEYTADPIPAADLDAMRGLVDSSVAPARLLWLADDPARRTFGGLMVDAVVDVADEEQSQALFAWWRSGWDEIQRHKDGLTIDGVGLPPLIRTIGKILPARRLPGRRRDVRRAHEDPDRHRGRVRCDRRRRPGCGRPATRRWPAPPAPASLGHSALCRLPAHQPDHRAHRSGRCARPDEPVRAVPHRSRRPGHARRVPCRDTDRHGSAEPSPARHRGRAMNPPVRSMPRPSS